MPPIRLPQSLQDELDAHAADSATRSRRKRSSNVVSRKDARKASRNEKKERKVEFFSRHRATEKRASDGQHPDAPPAKKAKVASVHLPILPSSQATSYKANSSSRSKTEVKNNPPHAVINEERTTHVTKKRRQKDVEDDKIAYLEAQLGLNKKMMKSSYSSAFAIDGLDDLLGDLDRIDMQLDELTGSEPDPSQDGARDEGEISIEEDEERAGSDDDAESIDESEWGGIQADNTNTDDTSSISEDGDEPPELTPSNKSEIAASLQATTGRYLPPALRKQQLANDSEDRIKLSRQLKGLLNRMSEQNIASVLTDIEDTYRKHSRRDVTEILTTLIIDSIASYGAHLDSFVAVNAALVGALHRLIGIEFAAHFVQTIIEKYDIYHAAARTSQDDGKACTNLLSLVAELYALQVASCVLLYDIVRELLDGPLDELDVELLLKLLRLSGLQMRADDPSALKDIVQILQDKAATNEGSMGSRTKFMVETLVQLKNGKNKRGADADGARDIVDRMKKFLGGLAKKKQVMAHEPIRVGLSDLREADKRGRWWIVGAAWSGDPLVEHKERLEARQEEQTEQNALIALARKHGMTTDVRKRIFVALMSSEDMVDASTRLAALGLTDVQQREVARVAVHCLGAERTYNPFWALVVQRTTTPAQKITLQFVLWDFLRGMGESHVGGAEVVKNNETDVNPPEETSDTKLRNIAQAYGWWIAKDACTITVLKPLEFQLLQPQTKRFLIRLLNALFLATQVATPLAKAPAPGARKRESLERVLLHAARIPALQQGLLSFLGSTTYKKRIQDDEFVAWGAKVAMETLSVAMDFDALDED